MSDQIVNRRIAAGTHLAMAATYVSSEIAKAAEALAVTTKVRPYAGEVHDFERGGDGKRLKSIVGGGLAVFVSFGSRESEPDTNTTTKDDINFQIYLVAGGGTGSRPVTPSIDPIYALMDVMDAAFPYLDESVNIDLQTKDGEASVVITSVIKGDDTLVSVSEDIIVVATGVQVRALRTIIEI